MPIEDEYILKALFNVILKALFNIRRIRGELEASCMFTCNFIVCARAGTKLLLNNGC